MRLRKTIDFALVSVSLLVVMLLFSNFTGRAISPLNNEVLDSNKVLFEIKGASFILLDDNEEFSSPEKIYLEDYLEIRLEPGVYYWKIVDDKTNEIRKLTILSVVDLSIQRSSEEDSFEVVNGGTEDLNVGVYEGEFLIDSFNLNSSETVSKNGTKFIGGKNEKD